MNFFKDFQTETKILLIVAFVALILTVGGILLLRNDVRNQVSHTPVPVPSPQPQTTEGWQTYRNDEFGFELRYPPEGEVTKTAYGPRIMLPLVEKGTNLSEKYLDIAIDGPSAHTGYLVSSEQVSLEGNLFTKEIRGGAAAGNTYDTESYIINYEGRKYNLSFTLHSGNIFNYDPSIRPKEFNEDEEKKIFDQILSTFRFVDYSQIQTLEIIPSEKSNEGVIYYQEGAKAIATGMNLSKVEFRQRGGGQIYTSPEGGLIGVGAMTDVKSREQKWEVLLPSERTMLTLCGVGFDSTGGKVGEVCLHNILPAGL